MKAGFYSKIALNNIKKNYRFYVPHILTGAGLLGCFYIMMTLALDKRLAGVRGGNYIPTFMGMGLAVMTILSAILILYTNSFLMKQRKREFGLYNILGMEKRHVARVIFHEMLISSSISIALGLLVGMLFYKLSSLLICRLLSVDIIIGFYFVTPMTLIPSALFFALLYVLTYAINRISIARMKPVELLASNRVGEREPKIKWLLLITGILTLGAGYYIAVTTESPLEAIYLFFVAVILVIIGTYSLFVAGSIFVLKLLKKNEGYYYNKKHMTAVSGLIYRMKQNAVGLASIAILATGVLVMISTTVSLYTGMQQTLDSNYPQHLYLSAGYEGKEGRFTEIPQTTLADIVKKAAAENRVEISSIETQRYLEVAYIYENGALVLRDSRVVTDIDLASLTSITYLTQEQYEYLTGKKLNLDADDIAVCSITANIGNSDIISDFLTIGERTYHVAETLAIFPIQNRMANTVNCYGVVVSSDDALDAIYNEQKSVYGINASEYTNRLAVTYSDRQKAIEAGDAMRSIIKADISSIAAEQAGEKHSWSMSFDAIWEVREAIYGMYGTLLFLGILLGLVCMFATVLIIYYKQISEGYEDRSRYQIMMKIGMSGDEVKKSIGSQILMVFFLPLIVAGVHAAFAFPILDKLLHILLLSSTWLFIGCSIAVYVVFALVYILIYTLTARTYYKIVH